MVVLSVIILSLFFASSVNAGSVSLEQARSVAGNWMQGSLIEKRLLNSPDYQISGEEIIMFNNQPVGYNFILHPVGHIIVPTRDELPAVKLYSYTVTLSMADDSEVARWIREELYKLNMALDSHAAELAGVDHTKTRNGRLWALFGKDTASFLRESLQTAAAGETLSLSPLLSTTWDQGNPYNMNTPLWYTGERTVTGCAATAMAQILRYWNYPPAGQSSTSYNWNNGSVNQTLSADFSSSTYNWSAMTNSYGGGSTADQKAAVAKLMSDVGIAFHMIYGTGAAGGSSANTMDGTTIYPTYFKYKSTLHAVYRSNYGSDSAWMQVFKTEVQNGRPSQFRMRDPSAGGHSIVIDGYKDSPSEQIHLNLGWSGSYDGWYVSNNIVTGSYHWSDVNYQAAIIGIHPNNACDNLPVKIEGMESYFTTLRSAYASATNGTSLQVQALEFAEDLILQNSASVVLKGGYECNYSANPGVSVVRGKVIVGGGTVTIANIVIR